MHQDQSVVIYTSLASDSEYLALLGTFLSVELRPLEDFPGVGLTLNESQLSYFTEEQNMQFDWPKQLSYHRAQKYSVKKELLAKALGIKGTHYKVCDLTCGTGKDSLLLTSFKAKVFAFERNPVVFSLLLFKYLEMSKIDSFWKEKMTLNFGVVTKEYLDTLKAQGLMPDALYFDPMFTSTNRKKSALKRKEMQVFDQLVGVDLDSQDFLKLILTYGIKRVVVKRHPKTPELLPGVTANFLGKNIRYDLYCPFFTKI